MPRTRVVGHAEPKVDAVELVKGNPAFTDDVDLTGTLIAKVLYSPHAHARIVSVDDSAARSLPGVHAVLHHGNVMRVRYASGGQSDPNPLPYDQVSFDDKVRYVGDRVAAVAADTEEIALATLADGSPQLRHYTLHNPKWGDPGICGGTMTVYLEPYMPSPTVFVIGCGHIGKAVVDLAHWLGYYTVAVDDRADLLTEVALPNADVRFLGSVSEAVDEHPITESASVVVVTRSHELDAEIVPMLVATRARYVGVMGSKRRWASTRALLVQAGLSDEALDAIHVPIGIEIGAETVEEIAVSIMSEIIKSGPARIR